MTEVKVVKAIGMERVLKFKKGDNEITVSGHVSNEETKHFIATLLRDGWKPAEKII